jgi:phage terminase large subunit-like protein
LTYRFDEAAALRVKVFIERHCKQVASTFASKPIRLLPWQWDQLIKPLFAWKKDDDTRKYRQAGVWIPRRNGKTTLMAAIALYMLTSDGEQGAQVYLVANTIEQARNCFEAAMGMVRQCPALHKKRKGKPPRLKILESRKRIIDHDTNSKLVILSSEVNSLVGVNASCLIFDEIGFYKKRELYTNLRGAMLNRKQPLILTISTCSDNVTGIGKEQFDYACDVRDGKIDDPTFLPLIYQAPEPLEWTDPATWRIANPSMGDGGTFTEDDLAALCNEAKTRTTKQAEFEMFHLNRWRAGGGVAWLPTQVWQACKSPFTIPDKAKAYGAIDLSAEHDVTAWVLCFPMNGLYYLMPRFFLPAANIVTKINQDFVPYDAWARQGYLVLTDGDVVDYAAVRQQVKQDAAMYDLVELAYDPHSAQLLCNQQLRLEDGINCVEHRGGMLSMSQPTSQFERLLRERKLRHDNPVLDWMAGNVVLRRDLNSNYMPSKKASRFRIDGIWASIVAVGRALESEGQGAFPEMVLF